MSALAPTIKGWCPGALRPMPTGDGLLVRVRVPAGRLSLDRAEAIAACAHEFGNGVIEISSRGNLQLRGVREDGLAKLQARLSAFGLIDSDPDVERLRNIVVSPLADIDPDAAFDVAPAAAALEARLAAEPELRALPAKFSFVIDAGGRMPLGDVDSDVRFEAAGEGFVVQMADLGHVLHRRDLPEVAARVAKAFLDLSGAGPGAPRRMRALLQRDGAAAVFAAAGLTAEARPAQARGASPRDFVGLLSFPTESCVGAAPAFGRTDAGAFAELGGALRSHGSSGLRLTPWRALIAVGLRAPSAAALLRDLAGLGFVVSPDEPRLGVATCPGAPACAHAERDTAADSRLFAAALDRPGRVVLHVSGCAKGCARAKATPMTLVATPEGYDLILDGRAGDPPSRRGLSREVAAAAVASLCGGVAA